MSVIIITTKVALVQYWKGYGIQLRLCRNERNIDSLASVLGPPYIISEFLLKMKCENSVSYLMRLSNVYNKTLTVILFR